MGYREDLKGIEERERAATAGKWFDDGVGGIRAHDDDDIEGIDVAPDVPSPTDRAFIAAARTDARHLRRYALALIEEVRAWAKDAGEPFVDTEAEMQRLWDEAAKP